MSLGNMLQTQKDPQNTTYHTNVDELTDEQRMEYLRTNFLALFNEMNEAMDETGWKPWATSNHIKKDAYLSELVDAFHFFMNLMLAVGLPPMELEETFVAKYYEKVRRNAERQIEGYDGVSTKCPKCGRAYDDSAVMCNPERFEPPGIVGAAYCETVQQFIDPEGFSDRYTAFLKAQEAPSRITHTHDGLVIIDKAPSVTESARIVRARQIMGEKA